MKKKTRSLVATWSGLATTILLAVEWIDFDSLDYGSVNTYVKLGLLMLPAVGGYMTEVKEKKP